MRGTFEEPPTGLIPWFSKTEGNTYATIAASPFPLQGKPTQAQDVATGCPLDGGSSTTGGQTNCDLTRYVKKRGKPCGAYLRGKALYTG